VGTRFAAGVNIVEESCTHVGTQVHITRLIFDAIRRIGINVIK
jgi:hypothetical protein